MSATNDAASLVTWTLSFLRPYRGRVTLVAALLSVEVALGALEPWLLKVVIDYVLVGRTIPEPFAGWLASLHEGDPLVLLITLVIVGVVLQIVHQVISAYSTQIQVDTGQRMVYS